MVSGGRGVGRLVVSGGGSIRLGLGVDSGSLVGHISNISVISVGGVLDVLDPDVGVNIKYIKWQKTSSSDTSHDEVVIMNRKVVTW